ncbi:Uma2 family endonuclease [Micromonospora foliorum]|uniref:Uma2 family endonuclease n=1 Tax=Micromonospora foliorum TaxID=2911210 RepID=UPI001EE948CE|nr:Uma2 family endonuclease [Micromonospora foliorum]MCG5438897.1 Uma2 family endonuclease [Micromonospora foliorum]
MSAWPNPTPPDRWRPAPARQQRADYQAVDLQNLPDDDSPRVEFVDGALQVTPFPTLGHQDIAGLLWTWLRRHAPADIRATQAVAVELGYDASRRPDVLLCRADVPSDRSWLRPHEVVLAVEIVSPGTRRVDRFAKPGGYAAAGIPFYWRIEQDPVHVYAYRIGDRVGPGGERQYELVADGADVIELTVPFGIKLPVAEITP